MIITAHYSANLELLVNQFNNATPKNSNHTENIHQNIKTMTKCIILNPYKCMILSKNFDDLQYL